MVCWLCPCPRIVDKISGNHSKFCSNNSFQKLVRKSVNVVFFDFVFHFFLNKNGFTMPFCFHHNMLFHVEGELERSRCTQPQLLPKKTCESCKCKCSLVCKYIHQQLLVGRNHVVHIMPVRYIFEYLENKLQCCFFILSR